jgi:hypothetical protein
MRAIIIWQGAQACTTKRMRTAFLCVAASLAPFHGAPLPCQTISPVIVEYNGKAEGKFQLTNDGLTPMAVVLEPRSFSVNPEGKGVYRPLDTNIHIDLSTMSFRLEPLQTYIVFYKARADALPAWFTVWATFTPINKVEGMKVRVMLPHTVYLYQKKPITRDAIHIQNAAYLTRANTVVVDLDNLSSSLVRVQEVNIIGGGKDSVQANGFPLLPSSPRHLEIAWKQSSPPSYINLRFPNFDVRQPLSIEDK